MSDSKPLPFEQLGAYRVESVLGRGGMGEVFLAWDERLRRHVAIKHILPDSAYDASRRARFQREARAVASLSHPSIVQIYDLLETEHGDCIVMEYIEGFSLSQRIAQGPIDLDHVLRWTREISSGLDEAHRKGIIHRDLKGDNVLISHGRAKILDFGLAQPLEDGGKALTSTGMLVGTLHAMSPEQAEGKEVDHRSDFFSLGILLYEMLALSTPFRGDSALETLRRVMEARPRPLVELRPDVPAPLINLADHLLARSPDDRPANARTVMSVLDGLRGDSGSQGGLDGPTVMMPRSRVDLDDTGLGGESATTISEAVPRALLLSQVIESSGLSRRLGDRAAAEIGQNHDRIARDLLAEHDGKEIDKTSGFLLLFKRPLEAVLYALDYQKAIAELAAETGVELSPRIGIHFAEILLRKNLPRDVLRGAKPLEVEGLAKTMAVRLMSLAGGRQVLLTRSAFDLARRALVGSERGEEDLKWLAHGAYRVGDLEEPLEVFEVGVTGFAPLAPPEESGDVRRTGDDEEVLGWHPAPGVAVPHRQHWVVEKKLGTGGFGEVWLVRQERTEERRAFKFCYELEKLHALQREITLFRLLKEELGDRRDIARILDWNFDEAPYFIESEYSAEGDLFAWAAKQGGFGKVPLALRLEIVAQVAGALAAAHSVGVLHKDVKPSNVLISHFREDEIRVQLADFGIGLLTERERLSAAGITALGITRALRPSTRSSFSGTQMYMAPELLEGRAATVQADIYALGVLLYQAVVGDCTRALAPGWERDVEDDLLREDIAAAVDGSPERRLGNALRIAERLRELEHRRSERVTERKEKEEAQRLHEALVRVRRRRRQMAVLVVVLTVFALVVTWLALDASHHARRADEEAAVAARAAAAARRQVLVAEQTTDFLVELFQSTEPSVGPLATDFLVDRGAARVEGELGIDPPVQARARRALGNVYLHLGRFEDARRLLEETIAQERDMFGEESPAVADSLEDLARVLLALEDMSGAEAALREAAKIRGAAETGQE